MGKERDDQKERRECQGNMKSIYFITLREYSSCLLSKAVSPTHTENSDDSSTMAKCQPFHITWKKFQEAFLKGTHSVNA